ncbi:hypothetical protein QQ054_23730 [Oscillatoria amoena NRMC-F 0135]|nr:hypothetical protein [Oscillatoria amoena NRMC-F 0135]
MMKSIVSAVIGFLVCAGVYAQDFSLQMLHSSIPTNLRGLSPVDDSVVWVCGSNGHVGKSTNGGASWKWMRPDGLPKADFRDVEAFDENRAVIMAAGFPAVILYTNNGGESWTQVFRSNDSAVFLDAMDFWNEDEGVCIGDWIDGKPYTLYTNNGGKTWQLMGDTKFKPLTEKTASFAASGTCVRVFEIGVYKGFIQAISSGTKHGLLVADFDSKSKLFEYEFKVIPYQASTPSQGIFSLCINPDTTIWVAGGDYAKPTLGYFAVMKKMKLFWCPKVMFQDIAVVLRLLLMTTPPW